MKEPIKKDYSSPRWSAEIADCSMPMTFDTYSVCSYNCLYCFSFFQKEHSLDGYLDRAVRSINPDKVKNIFNQSISGDPKTLNKNDIEFWKYIKGYYTMQWGGLADAFDEYERQHGVSLEMLKFFSDIRFPLSISTKATWFTKDERYMELIRKNADIWHFKISIITSDPVKAKGIERGVDLPEERFQAIKRLSDAGCHVTLRLRPFIIGISDDYKTTIQRAKECGADSVTTEFFCLETRASDRLKTKYTEMSKFCGYDLWDFYGKNSKGSGYRRLNYQIKEPYIVGMRTLAKSLNMRFYVSDAHHKEKCDYCCCCGVPPEFKVSKGHFAEALMIAKSRPDGIVKWEDIQADLAIITEPIKPFGAHPTGFNTGGNKERAARWFQTMYELVKEYWNTPNSAKSPYKYFGGVLYPIGLDENKNVIYKLNRKKAKI